MKFYVGITITVFFVCTRFAEAEQSYTVISERFEHYDGVQETLFYANNARVIGRQRTLNGTLKFLVDMDNEHFMMSVEIFHSQPGDDNYKLIPIGITRMPLCDGFKTYFAKVAEPSFVHGENTDFPYIPEEGLCPLPKGEYYFKNLTLKIDTWPTHIPKGNIKAKMTFFKDAVNIGAGALIMKVKDRE
ncbi:PREDICTED: uncharacterized protein LOC108975099 [Bactrocera latifrons]|uniref:uncharacterized protein LOC108975099 n=1 Tax=Bactrocera latifrons TaxID=174628 RepID=UPI0008DE5A2F|nr:PREDICTED: uncharacterized protein LOC108975099 [Bactrocera latifrons]